MPTAGDIELKRWDTPRSQIVPGSDGVRGMRPDGYEPYPKTLFRASRDEGGKIVVETAIAQTEAHHAELERSEGYKAGGPKAAQDRLLALEADVANAAAEAAGAAQRMSPKAREEYHAAEAASDEHVTDVTGKRKK